MHLFFTISLSLIYNLIMLIHAILPLFTRKIGYKSPQLPYLTTLLSIWLTCIYFNHSHQSCIRNQHHTIDWAKPFLLISTILQTILPDTAEAWVTYCRLFTTWGNAWSRSQCYEVHWLIITRYQMKAQQSHAKPYCSDCWLSSKKLLHFGFT